MERDYDSTIQKHYQGVASKHGLSPASTMEDERTRELETQAILLFLKRAMHCLAGTKPIEETTIMDVGCGNGYTLETVSRAYPTASLVGIEHSSALRDLASSRFDRREQIRILDSDVRDPGFAENIVADILICQRVLINLLDYEDQRSALTHIIDSVASPRKGCGRGFLLFIECFVGPFALLNVARSELDLDPISPAHHNVYLPDDFLVTSRLTPLDSDASLPPPNFLSTHYFVTRVLQPALTRNMPLKRNAEFTRFLSEALRQNVGDFAPLKLYMFEKVE